MNDHTDRRRAWVREYLGCDPNTGEPAYQEIVTEGDLVAAMQAEAEHWTGVRKRASTEVTPDVRAAAEEFAEGIRALGHEDFADLTPDEAILAMTFSNMVETAITLNPELRTRATTVLTTDAGQAHCLYVAKMIGAVRAAETPEEQAGAVARFLTGILAGLTQGKAKALSRLGR